MEADRAQLADVVSTGIGTASGLEEANSLVEPLVSGGPVGLAALAGVKLGINRLGAQQTPANCRTLLSTTTAAGWGATINNVALMIAPQLAIMAIPLSAHTYVATWRGSALNACYRGRLTYVVLSIPERDGRKLPDKQQTVIARIVGNWPDLPRIHGTRAHADRVLVQATVVSNVDTLATAIEQFDLNWEIVGAWNEQGAETAALRDSLLTPHLVTDKDADSRRASQSPNLRYDRLNGIVTLQIHDHPAWQIAQLPLSAEFELAQR